AISRGIRTGQGTLAGIVATSIEPDQLDSVVGIERAKQGGIGLIDKQGLLVYRSIPTLYTLEQRNFLKRFPIMAEALQGKEVLAEVTALSTGEPRLVAFAPVPALGWVASAGRPAAEVQRPIKRVLLLQAGTLLAVVLVGLGAAVTLARPIANGLIALRRQALAVGRDEIPQVAAVSGPKEITELAAVLNDMAAAVRAREAALRLSEQKFAKAFAANPAAIALTRFSDGRILDVNDTSLAVLGYRREEMIGRAVNELGVWCDPGRRSRYLEALRRDGHVRDWEVQFSNKSGRPVDVLLAAERITVNGEELILSTFLDITTRKQAQARLASQEALLRTILEQAAEEIVVRDAQGRLLLANGAVRRHALPASSRDVPLEGTPIEAVPHLWGQMLDTDGKPIRPEAYPIARVLRGEHVLAMEFQRVAPDGQMRTLLHSVAPLRDSQSMLIGAVAISIEITAQKQKEAELRQAHAELEQRVQDRTAELSQAVRQLERQSAQLRALASELTQAEERERERLARLLHDDLQQLLIGMKLVMGPLAQAADPKVRAVGGEVSDLL
ncbi:MAG TPA: PAS domain S-box protein, partial [Candidatus Methylomirabilis sp.]|nr:PAS domain S-box protein [Candidatus Methylomirabilis sp.]